jgi:hypothetical protein
MLAVFFKGFVLTYGVKLYHAPRIDEARSLLQAAASAGIGGATIELDQFELHVRRNQYDRAIQRF